MILAVVIPLVLVSCVPAILLGMHHWTWITARACRIRWRLRAVTRATVARVRYWLHLTRHPHRYAPHDRVVLMDRELRIWRRVMNNRGRLVPYPDRKGSDHG